MSNLNELSLTEAALGISRGSFSSEELLRDCLASIDRYDRNIEAWAWLDHEAAIDKARRADRKRRRGEPLGRLHGIPIGIKDIYATAGIPTGMGSPIFDGNVPTRSAAVVLKLEEAGAFVMGKTVTSEFASQWPGKTRNPWNGHYTPGGSSSGSAAAVAARFVPAAVGSQTRGSTIRPAAYCGIVGFKPSQGLLARTGMYPLARTLDHAGLLARSVRDVALLGSCCVGHDPLDPESLPHSTVLRRYPPMPLDLDHPRLAVVRTSARDLLDESQQATFNRSVLDLQQAGVHVEEVDLDASVDRGEAAFVTIHRYEVARAYRDLYMSKASMMSEKFRSTVSEGVAVSDADYLAALDSRRRAIDEIDLLFRRFDAILTPPATGEPPRTLASLGHPSFNGFWNLCRVPAVTIPAGVSKSGLPLGLQLVGPYLADDRLLSIAEWCELRMPAPLRWPADAMLQ